MSPDLGRRGGHGHEHREPRSGTHPGGDHGAGDHGTGTGTGSSRSHTGQPRVARTASALAAGTFAAGLLVSVPAGVTAAAPLIDCVSSDNGDPDITGLTISPAVVDVTDRPKKVTLTLSAIDAGGPGSSTGIRRVRVTFTHPRFEETRVTLAEGPSGDWVGSVTIPRATISGKWRVIEVVLQDRAGNAALYGYMGLDLHSVPIDHGFTVVSDVSDTTSRRSSTSRSPGKR